MPIMFQKDFIRYLRVSPGRVAHSPLDAFGDLTYAGAREVPNGTSGRSEISSTLNSWMVQYGVGYDCDASGLKEHDPRRLP